MPEKAGNFYFYTRNDGLQNQSGPLCPRGAERHAAHPDRSQHLGAGRRHRARRMGSVGGRPLSALLRSRTAAPTGGSCASSTSPRGRQLPDEIRWVKFSNIDWAKDGSGFFYSRFPAARRSQPVPVAERESRHLLPPPRHGAERGPAGLCDAGPAAPVQQWRGLGGRPLADRHLVGGHRRAARNHPDRSSPGRTRRPRRIITGFTNEWDYLGNSGTIFYWRTNNGAPRQRIVSTDVSQPELADPRDRAAGCGDA